MPSELLPTPTLSAFEVCRGVMGHWRVTRFLRANLPPEDFASFATDERFPRALFLSWLGQHEILVARDARGVAAVVFVRVDVDVAFVGWGVVRVDLRGRGLVRALAPAVREWLRGRGVVTARSGCAVDNPASLRLHEALGFHRLVPPVRTYGGDFGHILALDLLANEDAVEVERVAAVKVGAEGERRKKAMEGFSK